MKCRLSVEALSTLVHIEKKTMQYSVRAASRKTRAAVLAVMKATMATSQVNTLPIAKSQTRSKQNKGMRYKSRYTTGGFGRNRSYAERKTVVLGDD